MCFSLFEKCFCNVKLKLHFNIPLYFFIWDKRLLRFSFLGRVEKSSYVLEPGHESRRLVRPSNNRIMEVALELIST